jgi:hypothetical protein
MLSAALDVLARLWPVAVDDLTRTKRRDRRAADILDLDPPLLTMGSGW